MSNFTGVTFQAQNVRPSDDAIIRRMILSDGILYGCALSYSGSTLTMAAGQLLACGRQFEHPASQNWAVVDATSGYARLVLTIDLTKTATEETFEQVVDTIEYASSLDGFPDLEQTDVNTSGLRYQIVACVVSLGTGGITGIVEQLGPCEVAGGGGLNFKVVGGLTQPANPAENTIWVETEYDITSWIFSATEPAEPVEGMVWITTGTSSAIEFNALKKNAIQVYPLSAKQYVGGAWVDVTAMSYQGGEWKEWWDGKLYWLGKDYSEFTGGIICDSFLKITKNEASFTVTSYGEEYYGKAHVDDVEITQYNTLKINITDRKYAYANNSDNVSATLLVERDGETLATVGGLKNGNGEYSLDVSNISGKVNVVLRLYAYKADSSVYISVTFDKWWLER